MDLQITGQNVEVLPTVRSHIERKLDKLSRHLPNLTSVKVELGDQKTKSAERRYRAQVTLDANGTLLRAEERAENLLVAIDRAIPALDRQIERFKSRLYKKSRAAIATRAQGETPSVAAAQEEGPRVMRRKRFPVKLMTTDEAIEQMELLSHTFFLYHNADTKELNVVYRREDGNYSVIEPVLE